MKRTRRISAAAVLALAALVTGTGTGFAATTTPSATSVPTHAFGATSATATASPPLFQGALPPPTGPYAAGEDVIHLTDASRPDPWVPSSGPRQLTVTMVYPALPGTGTPAPYMTLAEADGSLQHTKIPASSGVTPENLSSVTTHAFDGAQPQRGKHPLVVLSPAYEDPRMVLTSLATDLASHGYVVALVGHTYEDSGETLANGQTPPCAICDDPALDFNSVAASRALDVSFVIDRLTHGDTAWRRAHLIDKHEIGMAGHSLGGAAAAATMITDPRVGAGVNMDGAFHPTPIPGQINRPFLMLGAAANHPVGGTDTTWEQTWAALGGGKKWLTVAGADHFSFSDLDLLLGQAGFPTPPLSPQRGVVITREYVTAFLDQTLKGLHSPLMDGPSPNNPEVLFQHWPPHRSVRVVARHTPWSGALLSATFVNGTYAPTVTLRSARIAADPGCRAVVEDECMIGDRWGVTSDEISRFYPCDDFVASPAVQVWRGVRVEAPAEAVWPWVAQIRISPYSYDWIDNLGRRSPRQLLSLPPPVAGEAFTTAGGRKLGRIVSVDLEKQLTGRIMGAFMSYVLVPQKHDTTRLLLKVVMQTNRWAAIGLSVGDLVMARRQLLNLKQLAERHHPGTATG